jgi:hypothetical protein
MGPTAAAATAAAAAGPCRWVGCSARPNWSIEGALVTSLTLQLLLVLLLLLPNTNLMLLPVSHRPQLPHCFQELLQRLKGFICCCELHLLLQC